MHLASYLPPRLNFKHLLLYSRLSVCLPDSLDHNPMSIAFASRKRLRISWFARLRRFGRCRNLEFTITISIGPFLAGALDEGVLNQPRQRIGLYMQTVVSLGLVSSGVLMAAPSEIFLDLFRMKSFATFSLYRLGETWHP